MTPPFHANAETVPTIFLLPCRSGKKQKPKGKAFQIMSMKGKTYAETPPASGQGRAAQVSTTQDKQREKREKKKE